MKTSLLCLGLGLAISTTARSTVSIEFQFGGVQVPAGSLGVLAADTGGNGFSAPSAAAGTVLSAGEVLGDDVIVAVFSNRNLPDWGNLRGFAEHLAVLDYAALGVAAGQDLVLHVFPDRGEGDSIRTDEPHLSYEPQDLGDISPNSTVSEFELPADGGAHLLAVIAAENGGEADLGAIDLTSLPYDSGNGNFGRGLEGADRHTYFFELGAAGVLSLEGTGDASLRAELYGPGGQLLASSTGGDFSFVEELAAGFHLLVLYRNGGAAGSLPYSFSFADSDGRVVNPDVAVGLTPARLIGVNRLKGAPGQAVSILSKRAVPKTGYASLANRGDLPNDLAVRGSAGNGLCRISYFAPTNVTSRIVSGAFRTPDLTSASAPVTVRVQFTPNKKKLVKKRGRKKVVLRRTFTTVMRASATEGPANTDSASIRVQTR